IFFFQAEDGIRDRNVTGVQTCALPIFAPKGLCAGLPLGATVLGEKVESVLGYGDNGSTFGGNPICCAGAISTLSRMDEALLAGEIGRASCRDRRADAGVAGGYVRVRRR